MFSRTQLRQSSGKSYLGKFCLIAISLIFLTIHIQAQNGWTRKANTLNLRLGCHAVVVNNKIYVMGGIDHQLNEYMFNEVYDPLSDTWEAKKSLPTRGGLISLAAVDGLIYAIGGGLGVPGGISEVFAYDPVTDSWNQRANLLSPRMGAAAGVIGNIVYNVGGNHYEGNCEAYNPTTDTWTRKADIPPETSGGIMVASHNGLLYAFGGGFKSTFSTTFAYDPVTNEWTKKANMPRAKGWSHPAPVVEGKIYIIGGYKGTYDEIFSDVDVYDPADDSWLKLPNAPFKTTFFGVAAVKNRIYIIGGTPDWVTGGYEVWEYTAPSVFVKHPLVVNPYAKLNADSVLFLTRFSNTKSIQFTPNLVCTNSNGSQVDSVRLYDDGLHGDSSANDGLYGAFIHPQPTEDFYGITVSTFENQTMDYRVIFNDGKFTTAGPLIVDSIPFSSVTGYRYVFAPYLRNQGTSKTVNDIKLTISSDDPWITSITPTERRYPDLGPGYTEGGVQRFAVAYDSTSFTGYLNLKFEISSGDHVYWVIDTTIVAKPTAVEDEMQQQLRFTLQQNYPNPFNPTTQIQFTIVNRQSTIVKVLDLLGREVARLVNEVKEPGTYTVQFDGTNLSSGMYFYTIEAGGFTKTKRLLLLR